MKKILFSLVVLSFLIGGYTVLAQDNNLPSPGITPDNPFYFLKTWKETIQNFFTFGAENKAKQFLHLADVRLAEYQKMIDKGKNEIAQKTLEKYEKQLNHALQKIEELKNKGKDIKDVSQKLENIVGKHIEVLEKNLEKAPEAAKEGLENAIENSSKAIKKVGGKDKEEKSCIDSGGTVSTSLCCKEVSDFPNLCLIGACGCSSGDSHEIKVCDCGTDKCFDGEKCVVKEVAEDETADWKIYRNEEYGFGVKYPEEWNVREVGASVIFNYREGCYFFIDIIPETHADYNEVSRLRERGEKEEHIIVGNTNGVYFDSIHVCSPPICPETLVRTIYIYKENNLFRITRYATKDNHESECINIFDQILSTFRFLK